MHGIVLAVIFFALTLAYLLVITSLAIAANDEVGHHVVTVVRTKMFLQAAAVTGSAAGGERLSDNLELVTTLLDSAQSSLDVLELILGGACGRGLDLPARTRRARLTFLTGPDEQPTQLSVHVVELFLDPLQLTTERSGGGGLPQKLLDIGELEIEPFDRLAGVVHGGL